MDDRLRRLSVHPGEEDRLAYVGWELAGKAAFNKAVAKLSHQGYAPHPPQVRGRRLARHRPPRLHQADQGTLVRWELAAAVTLAGDDEHGDPLDQGERQVECGRIRNQRGSCACGLRL